MRASVLAREEEMEGESKRVSACAHVRDCDRAIEFFSIFMLCT